MHVDRSRFLFLTASLAAAACNQPRSAATPETGGVDPAKSEAAELAEPPPDNPTVWLEIEPGTEDRQDFGNAECNNDVGRPAVCQLSPPGSHCESFDETFRVCRSYAEFLRPRAAEAAVDCMMAASGSWDVCDWQFAMNCTQAGVQASCIEPSTRSECESISMNCGGSMDVFSCQQALSAMKPQHHSSVASCIREFCEASYCVMEPAYSYY